MANEDTKKGAEDDMTELVEKPIPPKLHSDPNFPGGAYYWACSDPWRVHDKYCVFDENCVLCMAKARFTVQLGNGEVVGLSTTPHATFMSRESLGQWVKRMDARPT